MSSGSLDPAALSALEVWEFRGRVAINAEGRGLQARLRWRQDGPVAQLELSGPWGVGGERVRILGGEAHLWRDDAWFPLCGPEAAAAAAAELDLLCTGAPLHSLQYWLRGLPDPAKPFAEGPAAAGAMREFDQEDWRIAVSALARAGALTVPRRVLIAGPSATLKVVITDWELPPAR